MVSTGSHRAGIHIFNSFFEHLQMITKTGRIVARLRFQQLLCGISTGFEPCLSWELGGSDHPGSHLASPQGIPEKSSWVTWGTNYGEIWWNSPVIRGSSRHLPRIPLGVPVTAPPALAAPFVAPQTAAGRCFPRLLPWLSMGPMTSRKNGHGNHKQEGISYDWVLPKLVGTQNVCEYPRPRMKQGTCQTVSARHVCRGTQDENSMFGVDEIWNKSTCEDDGFSRDPRCFGCFTKHIQTNTKSHHYPELTAGAVSTWVWLVCCCFSDSQTINGLARSWNGHETNDKYIVIISHI